MLRKTIKGLLLVLGLFLLYVVSVLAYGTLTDWQPEGNTTVEAVQNASEAVMTDSTLSVVIWNVGYAGLGEESDFFYDTGGFFTDGGHMIRAETEMVEKNIDGMQLFTTSTAADVFLFQEVDVHSKRSYFRNQMDSLRQERATYATAFAPNYQVDRVPIPILQPWEAYGKVKSGLLSMSKWQPYEQVRMQFPGKFEWPTRIFQLDRCLLLSRIKTNRDKDLVIINAHLSAYDKGGVLKKQQMAFLKELALAEYEKGNYVIVGADWNQCPPNFKFDFFSPGKTAGYQQTNIAVDYLPMNWQWLYDASTPTNRKLATPYVKGESFTTLIDFFVVSPNLQALQVKTINQDFRYSDHQPVWINLALK